MRHESKRILLERIKRFEGYKPYVYDCDLGYPTIGYGTNLLTCPKSIINMIWAKHRFRDQPIKNHRRNHLVNLRGNELPLIDEKMAEDFALIHIDKRLNRVNGVFKWFKTQPEEVKIVLVGMAYNMGTKDLQEFKKMIRALKEGDIINAVRELLDSKYLTQTKIRAIENAKLLASLHKDGDVFEQIDGLEQIFAKRKVGRFFNMVIGG